MFDETKAKAKEMWDSGKQKAKDFYADHPDLCAYLGALAGVCAFFGTGVLVGTKQEAEKNEMWRRGINNGLNAGSNIYSKALQQNRKEDENN